MAKRKRAPGGGRKPRGQFAKLNSPLSIRMPKEMRTELAAAARKGRKSVTQELLRRLQDSFHRDRDKNRDSALRALCFLIGEVAESVSTLGPIRTDDLRPLWRSDPFLFRAFKLAVGKLLDALEPTGELRTPVTAEVARSVEAKIGLKVPPESVEFMLKTYESPEALSNQVFLFLWTALHGGAASASEAMKGRVREVMLRENPQLLGTFDNMWDQEFYGMSAARRDLQIKLQGEKS